MTNKEAIKRCKELINQDKDVVLTYNVFMKAVIQPYFADAIEKAIEALEKAEKYRWHKLKKDKNDLPSENGRYEVVILPKHLEFYWCSYENAYYTDLMGICGEKHWHNGAVGSYNYKNYDDEVIAWREIELIEEEQETKKIKLN